MKMRIAIIAALPREIAPLVRDWPFHAGSRKEGYVMAECDNAIAVCAGMGKQRVTRAFEIAVSRGEVSEVISAGYAGGVQAGLVLGSIHWPALVVDAQTGERYPCEGGSGTLVTEDRVVLREEKAGLAARWSADFVDMEAATVARLARMRNLPFRALRVVSDGLEDSLPDFNRFIDRRGWFKEARFAGYVALRPWKIPSAIEMGRTASTGSKKMAEVLKNILQTD